MCEDLVWPSLPLLLLLLLRLSPASTAAPGRESVNQQQLLQPYPAGVDLFEHEFTSVSAGASSVSITAVSHTQPLPLSRPLLQMILIHLVRILATMIWALMIRRQCRACFKATLL